MKLLLLRIAFRRRRIHTSAGRLAEEYVVFPQLRCSSCGVHVPWSSCFHTRKPLAEHPDHVATHIRPDIRTHPTLLFTYVLIFLQESSTQIVLAGDKRRSFVVLNYGNVTRAGTVLFRGPSGDEKYWKGMEARSNAQVNGRWIYEVTCGSARPPAAIHGKHSYTNRYVHTI